MDGDVYKRQLQKSFPSRIDQKLLILDFNHIHLKSLLCCRKDSICLRTVSYTHLRAVKRTDLLDIKGCSNFEKCLYLVSVFSYDTCLLYTSLVLSDLDQGNLVEVVKCTGFCILHQEDQTAL